jgi:hypothetical protein
MQYCNQELSQRMFFVNSDKTQLCYVDQLQHVALNPEIYFHPSSYPRISRFDSRLGSCFVDWYVPTENEQFQVIDNTITTANVVAQDLHIKEYQLLVDQQISKNIKEIYRQHATANLLYSGGSDSMVVLSYIIKLGFASRTRVICLKNHITHHPESLRYDLERQQRINNFYSAHSKMFHSVAWETVDMQDLVALINQGRDYRHIQNYSLAILFDRYRDQAWITGMHGNRTLLHQWVFLDQLRLYKPDIVDQLRQAIFDQHNVYSHSIQRLKFDHDPVPMQYVTHCTKPVHFLDGYQNNRVYSPLGCDQIFQHLRRVKLDQIDIETVANISFIKKLITKNSAELLSWMDPKQSAQDFINLDHIAVPTQNLNFDSLAIPYDMNHDLDGVRWLQQQLIQTQNNSTSIDINTITSVKNLQWIHSQLNKNSNAAIPVTSDQLDA